MELIYWKNDVIVIFHDVTQCSMTTIFLREFNVLILIFIIALELIQRNQFYFCEIKRSLCRISNITCYVKIAIYTWRVQSTSWTGGLYLFSVIRTLIMFKKQRNRLSKTFKAVQYVVTKQDIWILFSHREIRRVPRSDVPLSKQKRRKLLYRDGKR